MAPTAKRTPIWKSIHDTLRRDISERRYAPGDKLPTEAALAQRFGVSHATVNKIVKRLQRDGLVTSRPYRSIFLTAQGSALADASRKRHQIVLNFLRAIGVSARNAELDAEGIEHYVSAEALAAFEKITSEKDG